MPGVERTKSPATRPSSVTPYTGLGSALSRVSYLAWPSRSSAGRSQPATRPASAIPISRPAPAASSYPLPSTSSHPPHVRVTRSMVVPPAPPPTPLRATSRPIAPQPPPQPVTIPESDVVTIPAPRRLTIPRKPVPAEPRALTTPFVAAPQRPAAPSRPIAPSAPPLPVHNPPLPLPAAHVHVRPPPAPRPRSNLKRREDDQPNRISVINPPSALATSDSEPKSKQVRFSLGTKREDGGKARISMRLFARRAKDINQMTPPPPAHPVFVEDDTDMEVDEPEPKASNMPSGGQKTAAPQPVAADSGSQALSAYGAFAREVDRAPWLATGATPNGYLPRRPHSSIPSYSYPVPASAPAPSRRPASAPAPSRRPASAVPLPSSRPVPTVPRTPPSGFSGARFLPTQPAERTTTRMPLHIASNYPRGQSQGSSGWMTGARFAYAGTPAA